MSSRPAATGSGSSPAAWGIAGSFRDAWDRTRRVPARSRRLVLEAMGAAPMSPPDAVILARPGDTLAQAGELVSEDGAGLGHRARLPRDLPYGYHTLVREDGSRALLLAAPPRCVLPRGLSAWGWAVQLYAARSAASWGIGDFGDLAALGVMAAAQGAGFLAVSPTWAPNPGPEPEASPYYPGTRRFLNPLHLRIDDALGVDVRDLAAEAARLNDGERIDRSGVQALKLAALERAWAAGAGRSGVTAHADEPGLREWATFTALAERFGPGWRSWPEEFRDPRSGAVSRFVAEAADRVAFHGWVQRLLEGQLARAAGAAPGIGLVSDMPVGVDPGSFDAWAWQAQLASGVSLGAPPDRFNPVGQDWGMPPFVPHRLRAAGYRPFVDTLRAAMRHAGGLRIDHVLGLFRQWWVPRGEPPAAGTYVRFPAEELLAVLAIESHRAGAVVVGEDLGTVSRGVRTRLAKANVLGMRVAYFAPPPATSWPYRSMGTVTNHDLPTVVGTWTGADLDDQAASGLRPDAEQIGWLRGRLAAFAGVATDAEPGEVVIGAHRALAQGSSALVAAALEDACLMPRRANIPGTTARQRANWSHVLPATVEQLAADPLVVALAGALRRPRVSDPGAAPARSAPGSSAQPRRAAPASPRRRR